MPIDVNLQFDELPGDNFNLSFEDGTPDDVINSRIEEFRSSIRQGITFSQKINTTSTGFQYPIQQLPKHVGPGSPLVRERLGISTPSQENPNKLIEYNNAEASGVDTRTGSPAKFRAIQGLLGGHPEIAEAALEHIARQQLKDAGIDVPDSVSVVYLDENTGEPTYLRPETGPDGEITLRPTLVNPLGLDPKDVVQFTPDLTSAALEGSIGAAIGLITSPIGYGGGGVVAGSALGAFMTEGLRRDLARMLGVPDDIANGISTDDQLKAALWSIGGDTALAGIMAMRHIPKIVRGAPIRADQLPLLQQKMRESLKTIQDLRKVVGEDINFGFSIGQLTGDPVLLELEARMKSEAVGKLGSRIASQEIEARMAMVESVRRIMAKAAPGAKPNIYRQEFTETDDKVIEEAKKFIAGIREQTEDMTSKELDQLLANAPALFYNRQFWGAVQERMDTMLTNAEHVEQLSWKAFNHLIGWDEGAQRAAIYVDNPRDSFINEAMRKINLRAKAGLSQQVQDSHNKILTNLGYNDGMFMAQKYLDFNALHEARSQLNALLQRVHAREEVGWSAHDISSMIKAIDNQIATTNYSILQDLRPINNGKGAYSQFTPLQGTPLSPEEIELEKLKPGSRVLQLLDTARTPEEAISLSRDLQIVTTRRFQVGEEVTLENNQHKVEPLFNKHITIESAEELRYRIFAQWQAALQATNIKNIMFDNYTVNTILKRTADGTGFLAGPAAIRELAFKDNVSLMNVLNATGHNPEIKRGLIGEFEKYARFEIMSDGKWSPVRFAEFYNKHADMMATLFGEGVPDTIRSMDDLHRAVVEASTKQTRAANLMKEYFGNALQPNAPVGAVGVGLLRMSIPQIEKFRDKALKEAPDLWKAVQERAAVYFTNRFLSASTADVLGKNLNNVLEVSGGRLAAIYGQEFVDNARALSKVLDIHNLRAYKISGQKDTQPLAIAIPRNLIGPLDPRQRFISSVFRIYDRYGTKGIADLIQNPDALAKFVQIQKMSTTNFAAMTILADLGYEAIFTDEERQAYKQYVRNRDRAKPLSSEVGLRVQR